MQRSIKGRGLAYATAAILGLGALPAAADVLFQVTNTDAAIYDGSDQFVDFNGAGPNGKTFTFNSTTPNERIVVMFNAECSIAGDFNSWVNIDIFVDPAGPGPAVAIPPSNSDNAFCSGGSDSQNNWVSAVTIGTTRLANPGVNTVYVRVSRGFTSGAGSNSIRLDDMSLIVMN